MCLHLYQSKASRYTNGLTYTSDRVVKGEKWICQNVEENSSINSKNAIKPPKEKQKERGDIKSAGKQDLKWQ